MKQDQGGIILLMTLLLLGVVSALIVAQLEMLLVHQKAVGQFLRRQQSRHNMEQLALQIMTAKSYQGQSRCMIAALQNPNQVVLQLKTKHACVLTKDKTNYVYLLEDLGVHPCLQAMVQDVPYSTWHWRLTIAEEAIAEKAIADEGYDHDYLQIRVAKLADFSPCFNQQVLRIIPGLVSFRFWSAAS